MLRTTNGGASWSRQVQIPTTQQLDALSCPATTRCTAVGSGEVRGAIVPVRLHTSDTGARWTAQNTPAGPNDLHDVACLGTATCWAVGTHLTTALRTTQAYALVTHDAGAVWTLQASYPDRPTSGGLLNALACPPRPTARRSVAALA